MRNLQRTLANQLTASVLGIFFPSRCPVCEGSSDSFITSPVCSRCFDSIGPYTGPACRVCAMPFASPQTTICGQCMAEEPRFKTAHTYGLYEGALKEAIHGFKFTPIRRLWRPLGRFMQEIDVPGADFLIIPVPMRLKGLRQRGFNQAALLARSLAQARGLTLSLGVLQKIKDTPPQVGLSAKERKANVRGAFGVPKEGEAALKGASVMLVDDIITTGATVRECAKALKRAGAGEITVAALARTAFI